MPIEKLLRDEYDKLYALYQISKGC